MIELLSGPVVIPGKVPSIANIGMAWKIARIPTERIKNPATLKKKLVYDYSLAWRDSAVALLLASARFRAPEGTAVFIHVLLEFKPAKGKLNPAAMAQDIDNPSKAILDAIQKAGLVANDKQAIFLLLEKACSAGQTQASVRSLCAGRPAEKRAWLAGLALHGALA